MRYHSSLFGKYEQILNKRCKSDVYTFITINSKIKNLTKILRQNTVMTSAYETALAAVSSELFVPAALKTTPLSTIRQWFFFLARPPNVG